MAGQGALGAFMTTENTDKTPDEDARHQLVRAILSLSDEGECLAFLQDLCTAAEIEDLSQRLEIARGLSAGETYEALRQRLGASNTTITRVSSALSYGEGGYASVLKKI